MIAFQIAVIVISSLLLIAYVRHSTTVLSPAYIFTLFWTLQILFIVLGWFHYMNFKYVGIIYMLSLIAVYDFAYVLSARSIVVSSKYHKIVTFRYNYCSKVFISLLVFYVLADLYGKITSGTGLSSLFSLNTLLELSNQNSVERYEDGGGEMGILGKLTNVNSFLVTVLGGMMYHYYHGKKVILTLVPLFFLVFNGLLAGAKMGIITGFFLWGIGYALVLKMMDIKVNINFRVILYSIAGFVCFILVLMLTMMFRIGHLDLDTFNVVVGKMISYALGHLPAFDIWFSKYDSSTESLTFGGKVLCGITNPLGILERKQGVYDELLEISPYDDKTNVFTVFRFFVEDFGLIGSYLFMIFMGYITAAVYKNFVCKNNLYLYTTLLCVIYFFISWSFVTSVLAYTSYIATFFIFYFVLKYIIKISILKGQIYS